MHDYLENFFVGKILVDAVLRVGQEHLSPRMKIWNVELLALYVNVVAEIDQNQRHYYSAKVVLPALLVCEHLIFFFNYIKN